jgi:uncharacterized membrane protein YidH (DUF202 family)
MTSPESRDPQARGQDDNDPEERDPGLAQERTSLAWTRTAISFAALGGAVLRVNVITGLIILALAPLVWELGRMSRIGSAETNLPAVGATRIRLITASIVAVSLLSLIVALLAPAAPVALR